MLEFSFYIDRGGTFTDVLVEIKHGVTKKFLVIKLLSEDPDNYPSAPREAIRRVLYENVSREEFSSPFKPFPSQGKDFRIVSIRMGTTVATNALLERKGARTAFVATQGFKDLLEIGYQNRPKIFALDIHKHKQVYSRVIEVSERLRADGSIEQSLDLATVRAQLLSLQEQGIESLAISLMHAYKNPVHEIAIAGVAQELGFGQISLSSETLSMIKYVFRSSTTVIDAYLSPVIHRYLEDFRAGFSDNLAGTELLMMKSDGGLIDAENFMGANAILSGPAGGIVALSSLQALAQQSKSDQPLIGFDMGGTSTDVSRFAGDFDIHFQSEIEGLLIQIPQLDINTVAAGGGSRLFYENGMFRVGPESSGAHPGPVSYRKGGHLSITDANLVLGRLDPEFFPKVFGPNANQGLDRAVAEQAFAELKKTNNLSLSIEEIAQGFIDLANEVMARPIREVSLMKGFDIQEHILVCFGGAGAQHACAVARNLGIAKVYIHKYSGILSAYGIGLADQVMERQKPYAKNLSSENLEEISRIFFDLITDFNQGNSKQYRACKFLNLRYEGTDTKFTIPEPEDNDYIRAFKTQYLREFGFDLDRKIIVDDIRIRFVHNASVEAENLNSIDPSKESPQAQCINKVFLNDKWQEAPVYLFADLKFGMKIEGPALIIQDTATVVIERDCMAVMNEQGDLEIMIAPANPVKVYKQVIEADPIKLAIYSNRFMSIAEQMGRCLERTAISTNIKERRDFSCAIFDAEANLIANAPHQPVHLGSMGHAVKKQMLYMQPGDVILTNHPSMGGSHLPDMTVITPVFSSLRAERSNPVFFVANRAHHADIGGITPGSMPSFSTKLSEEGIAIKSFKICKTGSLRPGGAQDDVFQEAELRDLFKESRTIEDNISDLRAQIAANQQGIDLLQALIAEYGEAEVFAYMQFIQDNAEQAVRNLLSVIASEALTSLSSSGQATQSSLEAIDHLDDGSVITLAIKLNPEDGSALFDFTGTSAQLTNNLNTPEAVTSSAILYALRCMIDQEIPLNQGCLKPINTIIPKNSFLNPSEDAAVVGGNVLTSQRIVDVIFKAFQACAASQGCMNNISFGRNPAVPSDNCVTLAQAQLIDDQVNSASSSLRKPCSAQLGFDKNRSFGYYETIGGGAGAGPTWHGASGVHTHMTNTRITDPEILETRYPVMLEEFSIRANSGGQGKYRGGDGLVRVFRFLDDLDLSVLTERRGSYPPYGMAGGGPGKCGENILQKSNGEIINLGAKNSITVSKGDHLIIKTPGGGGWGLL